MAWCLGTLFELISGTQLAQAFEQKWIWIYYMNLVIYIYEDD